MSPRRSNSALNGKLIVASEKLEKMLKLRDTDLTAIGISFSGTQSPTADPGFGSRDRPDRRHFPPNVAARFRALLLRRSEQRRLIGRNPRAPSAIKEEKNSAWLATLASGSLKKTHWPLSVNLSVK
jgi:hypothetical protein